MYQAVEKIDDAEHIEGQNLAKFFEQLQKDKTVIRVHVLGRNYERLTIITGTRERDGVRYFLIDYPAGFSETVKGAEVLKLHFDFSGADRLPYVFRTYGGEIAGNEVWVRFPTFIERRQRRRSFRLEAPLGTRILYQFKSARHEVSVINISQGGALVLLEKKTQKGLPLEPGQYLKNLTLLFPSKEGELTINIREAVVRRLGRQNSIDKYHCAFQFIDVEKNEATSLNALIYRYQREYLRKMQLISD